MVDPVTVGLGIQVASTFLGLGSQRKARRARKRAEALAAKRATINNIMQRRAAAASLRRQQAQQQVAAIASGVGGGSGDKATRSSLQSQGLAATSYQRQQIELGAGTNAEISRANSYENQAGDFAALGSLAGGFATYANARTPLVPETVGKVVPDTKTYMSNPYPPGSA